MVITTFIDLTRTTMVYYRLAFMKKSGNRLSRCSDFVLHYSRNRRRRNSSYCGEIGPAPDNLIARDFKAEQPNQK